MLSRTNKFVLFFVAFSLSACATIDYETFNSNLNVGKSSAIVAQYETPGFGTMFDATLRFKNTTDGLIYTRSFSYFEPTVVEVKPGKYYILDGSTSGVNVTGNMPLIAAWYKGFEVKPGEIVNIGKFGYKPFEVKSSAETTSGKVWNALNSLGMTTKHKTNYVTYQVGIIDEKELQAELSKNFSSNKSKLVSRPLQLRLSEDEFQNIVLDASAADADGKRPTLDESRERVNSELSKYILNSITEGK